jgi:hypothetical protein
MLSFIIITFIVVLFYVFYACILSKINKCPKKCRRKKKNKECFVEHLEPTAKGQIMLTDETGNLSTFNLGSNKTFVSDGNGNITTVQTGLFDDPITANKGITGNLTGNVTGTTGTFTGEIKAATGNFTSGIKGNLTGNLTGNVTGNVTGNLTGNVTGTTGTFTGEIKASTGTFTNGITGITDYEVFYNPDDLKTHTYSPSTGVWNIANDSSWDPKVRGNIRTGRSFNSASDDADATGHTIDITIPPLQKTAYIYHLPWTTCRYFDIYGVLPTTVSSNSDEVFIKRVNAYQDIRNSSPSSYYDGTSIVAIPSIDRFQKIRIKCVKGRIHYMGIGFNKTMVASDSGIIHADNVRGTFNNSLRGNSSMYLGQDTSKQSEFMIWNKAVGMNTHLPYGPDGQNYLSGATNVRGGNLNVEDGRSFCIGDVCINKDHLQRLRDDIYVRRGTKYALNGDAVGKVGYYNGYLSFGGSSAGSNFSLG